jgi:hypothetical protein
VTMIDGGFPVESEGWRRRWIVKRRRFQLKRLFPIGSLNFWHLTIGSLLKENHFFFNFTPGYNCDWAPRFRCNLQISHWFLI